MKAGQAIPVEKGSITKRQKGLVSTALVYPNSYRAGMSSLGYQTVYGLINDLDTAVCERVFLPAGRSAGDDIRSIESGRRLSQFDIIAFSVSFENDYTHLVSMLRHAGIPLSSSGRHQSHPLVMAGGVACFLNPEPIAPFMDLFLLGEAESLIPEFFARFDSGVPRGKLLERLATEVDGVYVPEFYQPVYSSGGQYTGYNKVHPGAPDKIRVRHMENLETISTVSRIITSHTAFKDICLVETGRGCPHGCRFCSAGYIYRPPRFYPESTVEAAMKQAAALTDKVGLVSAAVSDHPAISSLCARGLEAGLKLSFSSLRADALTDELIRGLVESGVRTATIAPEAGSRRLRDRINKKIPEDTVISAVHRLVSAGIINIRFYFMIGLPFEEEDDITEMIRMIRRIHGAFLEASRPMKKIGTITLSINPFVPKPFTPFQWCSMAEESVLKHRLALLTSALKLLSNMQINCESFRVARINSLLATGDRRTSPLIERASEKGWASVLRSVRSESRGSEPCEPSLEDPLPWEIIDNGIKKAFLVREFQRAREGKTSPDCPMIDCAGCGICRE